MNGKCQFSESELDITALSGKKPATKADSALAFGDAAMEAASATHKTSITRESTVFDLVIQDGT